MCLWLDSDGAGPTLPVLNPSAGPQCNVLDHGGVLNHIPGEKQVFSVSLSLSVADVGLVCLAQCYSNQLWTTCDTQKVCCIFAHLGFSVEALLVSD